jgi:hypothetical protein
VDLDPQPLSSSAPLVECMDGRLSFDADTKRIALFARRNWVAIPSLIQSYDRLEERTRILRAAEAGDEPFLYLATWGWYSRLWREEGGEVRWERTERADAFYRAELDESDLQEKYLALSPFDLLLFPPSCRWLHLVLEGDLAVLAGEQKFVELIAGPLNQAVAEYKAYDYLGWPEPYPWIEAAHALDWEEYSRLPEGDEFVVFDGRPDEEPTSS